MLNLGLGAKFSCTMDGNEEAQTVNLRSQRKVLRLGIIADDCVCWIYPANGLVDHAFLFEWLFDAGYLTSSECYW